ncbi:unnamed protein product [Kuraishia capsulata CBS 1993]|uniref:FAD/NAD(P)-binding domain-containing protein n=1 Tax=Kuraishia capsulata CBS 1993 TaxID=1382522 RepID=W6MUV7_9ASCO|nr:uncharacterized protein KUCA_T00001916001 [Kuraishia capsulata CBS 1993]CDK25945.1 unnamed protein product [Kuraishia capsulata CBS 1993]
MTVDQRTVVVIGGGPYGVLTAQKLVRLYNHKVILISNLEYFYLLASTPRAYIYDTPSDWAGKLTIQLKSILPETIDLVIDDVVDIDDTNVSLKGHEDIPYDALVIATGAKWPAPVFPEFNGDRTIKGLQDYYEDRAREIHDSKHIAFVGAGFVGLEIVGELAHKYKDDIKKGERSITIYHGRKELLDSSYGDEIKRKIQNDLAGSGIKFVFDTKVVSNEKGEGIIEKSGDKIVADKIYFTTGPVANPPSNSIAGLVDGRNQVKIDATLRAVGAQSGKVFALGDVTDWPQKVLQTVTPFSSTVAHNVDAFLRGKTDVKKVAQPSQWSRAGVSLGPNSGYGQVPVPLLGYINIPRALLVRAKSKQMFTDRLVQFGKLR